MRPEIITESGDYFNFVTPELSHYGIYDIAHALSHICRYTGHTSVFYSVAQHSWLASYMVPRAHALEALMHDAAEAFIGDVSSPLKQLLPDYKTIEKRVEADIARRFGLPEKMSQTVKLADLRLLATEQRDLMWGRGSDWEYIQGVQPLETPIVPPSPGEARDAFLHRFNELAV